MSIRTGQTVYENVLSLDMDNNPVSAATFISTMTKDGIIDSATTISINLVDGSTGVFSASWSASTTGEYQMYIKNNVTNVIFVADTVSVRPDSEFEQNIYIGL